MASRNKKNRRFKKKNLPIPKPNTEEIDFTDWYNPKQACKKLDISISTFNRVRAKEMLIVSKRLGKIYVSEYHIQKYLRDGLRSVVLFLTGLGQLGDVYEGLFA